MAAKLTKAQIHALKMVERRDWPAGEPRMAWLPKRTRRVLSDRHLIIERPGTSEHGYRASCIVDLTDAGRLALQSQPACP